jgi:hypothetical protein
MPPCLVTAPEQLPATLTPPEVLGLSHRGDGNLPRKIDSDEGLAFFDAQTAGKLRRSRSSCAKGNAGKDPSRTGR